MPGWFNPHSPRVERITIIRRIGRMNAHRLRRGVSSLAMTGGGDLSPEALAKGETRVMSNKQQKRGIRPDFLCNLFRVAQYFHRRLFTGDNVFVNYDFGQIFFLGRFEHRFQ